MPQLFFSSAKGAWTWMRRGNRLAATAYSRDRGGNRHENFSRNSRNSGSISSAKNLGLVHSCVCDPLFLPGLAVFAAQSLPCCAQGEILVLAFVQPTSHRARMRLCPSGQAQAFFLR